ncbi:hypothetical protein BBP40_002606 [Aspergillus hancockii]|nr:hypothetical protein BBP40_002606 [Aspergillus hancockii]
MVGPDTVDFYAKPNYEDLVKSAKLGEVEHQKLGTSYISSRLGDGTKLLVWNHRDYTEQKQWTSDQSSIPQSSSVQCYQLFKDTTSVIGFRFKDATGGGKKSISLQLNLVQIGNVKVLSDESDKYAIAGTMPRDRPPVTTAVYVRNEKTGVYIATRSIYFQWDKQNQKVVIKGQEGWPNKPLQHHDDGNNNFTITLISTSP